MDLYVLIKELIDLVGEFNDENKDGKTDLAYFLQWLRLRNKELPPPEDFAITKHSLEAELAAHLSRLNRYANSYMKLALEGLPFSTEREFAFTAVLDRAPQVGKTELIRMMAFDKSSGMNVIRRLLARGIIEEFPNPLDKRGKFLRLTSEGKKAIGIAYQRVSKAAEMVSQNLSNHEKAYLLLLLKKLDGFHYPIYLTDTQNSYLS